MIWNNQARNTASFSNASRHTSSSTNASRHTAVFSSASRATSVFTTISRTLRLFGDLTFDEIGALTFDGMLYGRPVGDWTFDDKIGPVWSNQHRNI